MGTAAFEMRVLPRNGIPFEDDLIVRSASDPHPRPVHHEPLSEQVRFFRIDDDETVVTRFVDLILGLALDYLRDAGFFVEVDHVG